IAGSYTVTVTDSSNMSTATASCTITQPPVLTASNSSVSNTTCNGGCDGTATVSTSGGTAPYTYAWAPTGGTVAMATGLCAGCYTCTVTDANACTVTVTVCITQPPPLTPIISSTNSACNSNCTGTATVTNVIGGIPPYAYNWSIVNQNTQTATGLCPATYTLTVSDSYGCFGFAIATITQPTALTQSVNSSSGCSACTGAATLTTAGGTLPYSYSWAPNVSSTSSASSLCTGNYNVLTTDNNGCTITSTFTITNGGLTISTTSLSESSCAVNGEATVNIVSGTGPYTYLWTPGNFTTATITGLAAGSYSVIVTDACSSVASATVTITQDAPLTGTATATSPNCPNMQGTGTVIAAGGTAPYTYLWQPSNATTSTTNLFPGNYHIIVGEARGCFISVYDTVPPAASLWSYITTVPSNCILQSGEAIVHAFGGSPPYTYLWSNATTNDTASGLAGGNYSVTVTDNNGCVSPGNIVVSAGCDNIITGRIYLDPNLNCTYDAGDSPRQRTVYATPGNYSTIADPLGYYTLRVPVAGTYTQYIGNYMFENVHCPAGGLYNITFPGLGDTISGNDFAQDILTVQDIGVWISSGIMRPGFPGTIYVHYYNNGNVPVSNVVLTLNHDVLLAYNSASVTPATYSSPTATWNLGTLLPGQNATIAVNFTVAVNAVINTYLNSDVNIMPVAGDNIIYNNYATDSRIVQGAYDPNIKSMNSALHNPLASTIPLADSVLTYTIHFQNTGTDTAFNIVVVDTLSQNLDATSIVPGPSSNPYTLEMVNGVMKFNFYNILLPDSNRNEPGSHGWFSYQVNTKNNIAPGDVINNTAGIYFDYNAPVFTNTTSDTIIYPLSISEIPAQAISAFPNPFDQSVQINLPASAKGKICEVILTDAAGRVVLSQQTNGTSTVTIERGMLERGIYFCSIRSEGQLTGTIKLLVN
ncbi:MAG: T9SS type A sorting domain-containing protein, partial [Bacteroidota bacterium]|nr:T9SS type A sorting domain-containing protein [Bacteroidota bacterium]